MGDTPEERVLKATGMEKTLSQKFISKSQEGNEGEFSFNNYGSFLKITYDSRHMEQSRSSSSFGGSGPRRPRLNTPYDVHW